jgi:hypothetical protein
MENESATEYRQRLRRQARERSRERIGRVSVAPDGEVQYRDLPARENVRYDHAEANSAGLAPQTAAAQTSAMSTSARKWAAGMAAAAPGPKPGTTCGCDHDAAWHQQVATGAFMRRPSQIGACLFPGCDCSQFHPGPREAS